MTRQIIDHPKTGADGSLTKTFGTIAWKVGAAGPHRATLALQRRVPERGGQNRRLQEYLRIDLSKR